MSTRSILILFIFIAMFCSCKSRFERLSEKGILITKAQYGQKWPFRLDSLQLFCGNEKEIDIYAAHNGKIYAINSKASDMADSEEVDAGRPWDILVKNADSTQLHTCKMIQNLVIRKHVAEAAVQSE